MAKVSREQLKQWFVTGLYPKQSQFWDWIDSYFHKDDKIGVDNVEGLADLINEKYPEKAGKELEATVDGMNDGVDMLKSVITQLSHQVDDQNDVIDTTAQTVAELSQQVDSQNNKINTVMRAITITRL